MKHAALFAFCALLAACTSPVQSLIYAAAGKTYVPDPRFAQNPPLFVERSLMRPDGAARQYFWHETDSTSHTVVYLHGNGEIAEATARSNLLAGLGGDTAILEYTGYGANDGTPSEAELRKDAAAIMAHLRQQKPQQKIIVVGFSIGGSLAALLSSKGHADGLVTVAAFTTLKEVAPAIGRQLIGAQNIYDTRSAARDIDVPWVILHCANDPLIPVRMARELAAVAGPDARIREVRDIPCDTHFVPVQYWRPAIEAVKSAM